MVDLTAFHALQTFRAEIYRRLGARRDALFEVLDAAISDRDRLVLRLAGPGELHAR